MRVIYGKFLPTFKWYTCHRNGEVWMINLDWAVHRFIVRAYDAQHKPKRNKARK